MKATTSWITYLHPFFWSKPNNKLHHQPEFYRRPRPSALLVAKATFSALEILRRCSPHRAPSNLRGYLRPPACRRDFQNPLRFPSAREIPPPNPESASPPRRRSRLTSRSKISAAGSRYPGPGVSLSLGSASTGTGAIYWYLLPARGRPIPLLRPCRTFSQLPPQFRCWHLDLTFLRRHRFAFVNAQHGISPLWKINPPPPHQASVIAGDTTYGVSLLTGTISGSNFTIPP